MRNFKSLLALLALSLVTVFAVGCGDSDNFVFTGNTNTVNPGNTGNLSFRFDRALAQTEGEVPAGTTQLLFTLHSGNPPTQANLVEVRLVPFSEEVILEDVDPSVTVVVVTALTAEDLPLAALQGNASVIVGTTQPVDLGSAEPISFDAITVSPDLVNVVKDGASVQLQLTLAFGNGTVITLPSFNAPEVSFAQATTVANITSTGLVSTGVGGQNTTATATFNLFGTSRSDDFEIHTFCFDVVDFDPEIDSTEEEDDSDLSFRFVGPNGVVINGDQSNPNLTWALESPIAGVTINSTVRGDLTTDNVAPGTLINVVVTYTDPVTGVAVSDTYTVEVINE